MMVDTRAYGSPENVEPENDIPSSGGRGEKCRIWKMTDQIRVLYKDLLKLLLKTSNIIIFVCSHTTTCSSFL